MEVRMRGLSAFAALMAAGVLSVATVSADTSPQQPTGSASGRITGIAADPAPASFAVLSTDLVILDLGAPNCPPKVEISAIFNTNMPGMFKYVIGTSAGPNKHGILKAKKVGNAYRAQAALTIEPIKSGELKVHAIANGFPVSEAAVSKIYKCGVGSLKAN
jgi:hypothetical protein